MEFCENRDEKLLILRGLLPKAIFSKANNLTVLNSSDPMKLGKGMLQDAFFWVQIFTFSGNEWNVVKMALKGV